jgi:hypothetical protein
MLSPCVKIGPIAAPNGRRRRARMLLGPNTKHRRRRQQSARRATMPRNAARIVTA